MAVPNTTPTPNELYNGEMKKMNDTELRVVLLVTRATLGWMVDRETGMRKQEDWISHSQLIKKSGRSSPSISKAVNSCVNNEWIETRDKDGKLLKTALERKRRKIYYRLGRVFLDKMSTKESLVDEDGNENLPNLTTKSTKVNNENLPNKLRNTKEIYTKEIYTKDSELAHLLYDLIKQENPDWHVTPNWDIWADDIRKLREIDERTVKQIEFIIRWCQQDNFWHKNILSPAKLRKQFNRLVVEVKSKYKNKGRKIGIVH